MSISMHSKFIKYILLFLILIFILTSGAIFFVITDMKNETPHLSTTAQKIGQPSIAFAFNYSQNVKSHFEQLLSHIGFKKNRDDFTSIPDDLGANGFFYLDIKPELSLSSTQMLNEFLSDLLNFSEAETNDEDSSQNNNEFFSSQDSNQTTSNISPFSQSFIAFLKDFWSSGTLQTGGAIQLNLSTVETVLLGLEPYVNKNSYFFTKVINKFFYDNLPDNFLNLIKKNSFHVYFENTSKEPTEKINQSQITFSLKNEKNNNLALLLSDEFQITIDIYWVLQGKTILFSNQKSTLLKMLSPNTPLEVNNILTSVSASGDDFLFSKETSKKYTQFSILLDMLKIQNESIDFLDRLKINSNILKDYFSSPQGEEKLKKIETDINLYTSYFEKASLTLNTDGNYLVPEVRLYKTSQDLFSKSGKELSPEIIASLEDIIKKSILPNNLTLPEDYHFFPKPNVKRNGKWVIISNEIQVKRIAHFIKNFQPIIDTFNQSTQF